MKYYRLIISVFVAVVFFVMPFSAQAASSSSVTKSILNAVGGEDFSGKNLIRAEFTNATFKNTNFSNADLRGAVFNGVFLDIEEDMKIYKDHEGDVLYNAWDVSSGEIVVYAESRFIHYMELIEEQER